MHAMLNGQINGIYERVDMAYYIQGLLQKEGLKFHGQFAYTFMK